MLSQRDVELLADSESEQPNSIHERGSVLQRARLFWLANRCCEKMPGDLCEIGVYAGGTSTLLAQVARAHGRKLVCVDNWQGGDQYNLDQIGKIFKRDMQQYADVLILIEGDAHTPEIIERIQERRYCLAFSDDGHDYSSHVSELETLLPVCDGLIAVDDIYVPDVPRAVADVLAKWPDWEILRDDRLRELWLKRRAT